MNDIAKPDWTALTKEQKGALIRPYIEEQHLSYSQVAAIVGASRVAIAGVVDRNDIKSPFAKAPRPKRKPKPKPRPDPQVRFSRIAPTQPIALPADLVDRTPLKAGAWTALPGSAPRPLHDLDTKDCKCPLGDGPFSFCGQPVAVGRVYCAHHAALAYKPIERNTKKGTEP